jgi:energy-coupling factor transport system ATP-binding protein
MPCGRKRSRQTTALSVAAGIYKPYRGIVKILGKNSANTKTPELYNGIVSLLPQQPQALFVQNTVENELKELSEDIKEVVSLTELEGLLSRHPLTLAEGSSKSLLLLRYC